MGHIRIIAIGHYSLNLYLYLYILGMKNRTLICTSFALLAGLSGGYFGGQMTSRFYSQQCQQYGWGVKQVCQVWVIPGAIWQGSITGIWTGTILGAFSGGLITQKRIKRSN